MNLLTQLIQSNNSSLSGSRYQFLIIRLLRFWKLMYNQRFLSSFLIKKMEAPIKNLEKLMKLFAKLVLI